MSSNKDMTKHKHQRSSSLFFSYEMKVLPRPRLENYSPDDMSRVFENRQMMRDTSISDVAYSNPDRFDHFERWNIFDVGRT